MNTHGIGSKIVRTGQIKHAPFTSFGIPALGMTIMGLLDLEMTLSRVLNAPAGPVPQFIPIA
jgi:hypothetical protein